MPKTAILFDHKSDGQFDSHTLCRAFGSFYAACSWAVGWSCSMPCMDIPFVNKRWAGYKSTSWSIAK